MALLSSIPKKPTVNIEVTLIIVVTRKLLIIITATGKQSIMCRDHTKDVNGPTH